jgi:glyoxylase-like metal-dependent hydrolase (beta-lactamase superfamily II)
LPGLFVFHEPRHYEATIVSLIEGRDTAVLIDTGCGIGDLGKAVAEVTDKPVIVVNRHTHSDHLGGNHQFEEIAMFDHPLCRRAAEQGVSHEIPPLKRKSDRLHLQIESLIHFLQPLIPSQRANRKCWG